MTIEDALNKLFSLHQFGVKLGLENITRLADFLNNPQNQFPSVHIAGSNGKGSTASFLSSILMENGLTVGLYTSPHLIKFNERIRINGKEISNEKILSFIEKIKPYIQKYRPTFFELTTALAFEYFAENKVDVAVIETGLGGRLDATNIIKPMASVITTISIEHENILGKSIPAIANEKAGIIKPNTPVFTGLLNDAAIEVIENKCRRTNSQLFQLSKYLINGKSFLKIKSGKFKYNIYSTGLRGHYQLLNSALAVLVANKVFNIKDYKIFNNGLFNVVKNSGISGRYEIFHRSPEVIFDAAHNQECIEVFIKEFKNEKCPPDKAVLIFGAMKDKNINNMLGLLKNYFNEIYATTINYKRAATIQDIQIIGDSLGLKIKAMNLNDIKNFINDFVKKEEKKSLVILGSIYIIGEIKKLLI